MLHSFLTPAKRYRIIATIEWPVSLKACDGGFAFQAARAGMGAYAFFEGVRDVTVQAFHKVFGEISCILFFRNIFDNEEVIRDYEN